MSGIVLRGYREEPPEIRWWKSMDHPWWVAVWWSHMVDQKYLEYGADGRGFVEKSSASQTALYHACPVDPSIVLVLDAWIRFFEVWEPQ